MLAVSMKERSESHRMYHSFLLPFCSPRVILYDPWTILWIICFMSWSANI